MSKTHESTNITNLVVIGFAGIAGPMSTGTKPGAHYNQVRCPPSFARAFCGTLSCEVGCGSPLEMDSDIQNFCLGERCLWSDFFVWVRAVCGQDGVGRFT